MAGFPQSSPAPPTTPKPPKRVRAKKIAPESPPDEGEIRLRLTNPKVVEHTASMLIRYQMDSKAAIRAMFPEITDGKCASLVSSVEANAAVKAEVERQLEDYGLGDNSKKKFVEIMWGWMGAAEEALKTECWKMEEGEGGEKVRVRDYKTENQRILSAQNFALKAATILGKGFIGEKIVEDKPQELPLGGLKDLKDWWESGLKKEGGGENGEEEEDKRNVAVTETKDEPKEDAKNDED